MRRAVSHFGRPPWQKSTTIGRTRATPMAMLPLACCEERTLSSVHNLSVKQFGSRLMLRWTLALVAINGLLAVATSRAQDIDELLRQAAQAAQRGDHERATSRLSDAIKQNPKLALAWYQ